MITRSKTQAYADRNFEPMTSPRRAARRLRLAIGATAAALALAGGAAAEPPPDVDAPVQVEVTGTLAAEPEAVRAVLLDLEGFARWFPALDEWRLPWPVSDRDYVVRYRWQDSPDGSFRLEAVGRPDAGPAPSGGAVRLQRLRSEWRIGPDAGGGTRASYRYEGESGPLPAWVARRAWRSQTRAVLDGLARELERRAADAR
jgi:carbon monoxide dehydrogenase subunit G